DSGDAQQHAQQGGLAPSPGAQKRSVRAELHAGGTSRLPRLDPLLGFLQSHLEKDAEKGGNRTDQNAIFHALLLEICPASINCPMPMLIKPAVTLPTADSACNQPRAPVRASSGNVSAINATANPNTPPTPSPVTKR